jgi:hypothetical protein
MPSASNDVVEAIRQLEADRRRHEQAINAIDEILARVSRAIGPPDLRGTDVAQPRIPSDPPANHRGKFGQTGEQSILQFIRLHGNPSTSEINEHWRAEGRRGFANVVLHKLIKQGRLYRTPDPHTRGSRYAVAPAKAQEADSPVHVTVPVTEMSPPQAMGNG